MKESYCVSENYRLESGWCARRGLGLRIIVLLSVLISLALTLCEGSAQELRDLVPTSMSGWKTSGKDGLYDRKTLFQYINGAAEVYLAYDFRQAFARKLVKPGQPPITVDVFDMGSSEDAYGIFTFERESGDVGIGQDSEYAAGLLRFWKGRYFVSILADRETSSTRKAVMALGKAVESRIKSIGARPKMLAYLPKENLIHNDIRFFHRKSGLDYQFYISERNVFALDANTDVLLARYKLGDAKVRLILVQYPAEESAKSALDSFIKAIIPDSRDGASRLQKGTWIAAKSRGRFVAVVFDAPTEERATSLIGSTLARIIHEQRE